MDERVRTVGAWMYNYSIIVILSLVVVRYDQDMRVFTDRHKLVGGWVEANHAFFSKLLASTYTTAVSLFSAQRAYAGGTVVLLVGAVWGRDRIKQAGVAVALLRGKDGDVTVRHARKA